MNDQQVFEDWQRQLRDARNAAAKVADMLVDCRKERDAAYAAGERAGAERQREADAKLCHSREMSHIRELGGYAEKDAAWNTVFDYAAEAQACAAAIRAHAAGAGAGETK